MQAMRNTTRICIRKIHTPFMHDKKVSFGNFASQIFAISGVGGIFHCDTMVTDPHRVSSSCWNCFFSEAAKKSSTLCTKKFIFLNCDSRYLCRSADYSRQLYLCYSSCVSCSSRVQTLEKSTWSYSYDGAANANAILENMNLLIPIATNKYESSYEGRRACTTY